MCISGIGKRQMARKDKVVYKVMFPKGRGMVSSIVKHPDRVYRMSQYMTASDLYFAGRGINCFGTYNAAIKYARYPEAIVACTIPKGTKYVYGDVMGWSRYGRAISAEKIKLHHVISYKKED